MRLSAQSPEKYLLMYRQYKEPTKSQEKSPGAAKMIQKQQKPRLQRGFWTIMTN